jgi:AraC-like DNA-binding protein
MNQQDLLSELFSNLKISSEIYFQSTLLGQCGVTVPAEQKHFRFHIILKGCCWIVMDGHKPQELKQGDIVLVPNGLAHNLNVTPDALPLNLNHLIAIGALADQVLTVGVGNERTRMLCGFCNYDEQLNHPIMANLPTFIHLKKTLLSSQPWLDNTMQLIALESQLATQGSSAILGRLIEIAVIQSTRLLIQLQPQHYFNFISALADPALSKVLIAIHQQPQQPWTVGELAVLAGMSRASFAKRFLNQVGCSPIAYLTNWRMMRARSLLADTKLSVDKVAELCGYASTPSFSKRFSMQYQIGPGAFRKQF